MTSNILNASILFALIAYASACSCFLEDFETLYYRNLNGATPFTLAKVLSKITEERTVAPFPGAEPFAETSLIYRVSVELVYDECRTTQPSPTAAPCGNSTLFITHAATPLSSAMCGVTYLETGVTYLMTLSTDPLAENNINLCQFITSVDKLKPEEKAFLDSRLVHRNGECTCAESKPVICSTSPCTNTSPPPGCTDADKCIDNTCGECKAEFFTLDNLPSCRLELFGEPETTPASEELE